jgi:hypothetical protein
MTVGAAEKSYEAKLATLVRMLGTEHEGEALAAWRALKRLLASRDASFTDLGDAIEKLANGGLEHAELERVFNAGLAQGRREVEQRHREAETVYGKRPDGSWDWETIATYCQRQNARLHDAKEMEFVNDMTSRLSFAGREPTEKQSAWLLAIFRRLGGRVT